MSLQTFTSFFYFLTKTQRLNVSLEEVEVVTDWGWGSAWLEVMVGGWGGGSLRKLGWKHCFSAI